MLKALYPWSDGVLVGVGHGHVLKEVVAQRKAIGGGDPGVRRRAHRPIDRRAEGPLREGRPSSDHIAFIEKLRCYLYYQN